jgi:hypothetical protein
MTLFKESPNFSFSTLSIPIFIVVVELGHDPQAPAITVSGNQ